MKDVFPKWILISLVFALISLVFYNLTPRYISYTDDFALALSVSRSIFDAKFPLMGPSSHVGGRHLGPFYYYYSAAALALGGGDTYCAILVMTFFRMSGVLLLAFLVYRLATNKRSGLWYAIGTLVFSLSFLNLTLIRSNWEPIEFMLFSPIFLLSCWWCINSDRSNFAFRFPWVIFFGSVMGQIHYSSGPVVLTFGLSVLLINFFKNGIGFKDFLPRNFKAFSGTVATILLWIPPILYQFLYAPILLKGINHVVSDRTEKAGYLGAIYRLLSLLGKCWGGYFWTYYFDNYLQVLTVVCSLTVFIFIIFKRCEISSKAKLFVVTLFVAAFFICITLANLHPPLRGYYQYSLLPLPTLVGGLALGEMLKRLYERVPVIAFRYSNYCFLLFSLIFIFSSFSNLNLFLSDRSIPKVRPDISLENVKCVSELIALDAGLEKFDLTAIKNHKIMTSAYLSLLPNEKNYSEHYPKMAWWDVLKEMPQIASKADIQYLISCPKLNVIEARKLNKKYFPEYRRVRQLDLSAACPLAKKCNAWRYQRKNSS
jgi:hypothetical protein